MTIVETTSARQLRIALAQIDSTVGDLEGNARIVVEWTRRAAEAGAGLVVFPEMMITGYPVEDLALRASCHRITHPIPHAPVTGAPTARSRRRGCGCRSPAWP